MLQNGLGTVGMGHGHSDNAGTWDGVDGDAVSTLHKTTGN